MRELDIPSSIIERDRDADEAAEFIRFWLADGIEHVSLNIGAMGEQEITQWGMMLADLTVHIINGLKLDGAVQPQGELRYLLEQAYVARLNDAGPDHVTGSLLGAKH